MLQEAEYAGFRSRMEEVDTEIGVVRDTIETLRNRIFSSESRITTNGERSEEARSMIERHRQEHCRGG